MNAMWTKTDLDIVETLARRVRLLSVEQVARVWWPELRSLRVVRRQLRRLRTAGLVAKAMVNVHPLLDVRAPLVRWTPGEDEPDFARIAARAKGRWQIASIPHQLFLATRLSASLFGSSAGHLPELTHRDHDLLLGQVYVLYRTKSPADATQWVGKDARAKAGYRIRNPDACLLGSGGQVIRVIQAAGRYSQRQVEAFHEHCAGCGLPYELW